MRDDQCGRLSNPARSIGGCANDESRVPIGTMEDGVRAAGGEDRRFSGHIATFGPGDARQYSGASVGAAGSLTEARPATPCVEMFEEAD